MEVYEGIEGHMERFEGWMDSLEKLKIDLKTKIKKTRIQKFKNLKKSIGIRISSKKELEVQLEETNSEQISDDQKSQVKEETIEMQINKENLTEYSL